MYSIPTHVFISESQQLTVKQPVNIFSKKSEQVFADCNQVYAPDNLPEQVSVEQFTNLPQTGWEFAGVAGKGVLLKAPFVLSSTLPVYVTVELSAMQLVPLNTGLATVAWQFISVQGKGIQLVPASVLQQDSMTKYLVTSNHIQGAQLTSEDAGKVLIRKGAHPLKVVVSNFDDVWVLSSKGFTKPSGIYEYTGWQVSDETLNTLYQMRQLERPLLHLHPDSADWQNFRSLDQELVQLMMELSKPHSITLCEANPSLKQNMSDSDAFINIPLTLPPHTKAVCSTNSVQMARIDIEHARHVKLQLTRFRKGVRISLGVRTYYRSFSSDRAYVMKIDFSSVKAALSWISDLFYHNPQIGVVVASRDGKYYAYNTDSTLL